MLGYHASFIHFRFDFRLKVKKKLKFKEPIN